ncbi:hypothetical protein SmJEL517_g01974 [Synchytrium microbalum]|uniref:GrpE protein homolog n=1 Tax=Synchytrium microbalum TaxID=1806994 RepID=A0A507CCS5_9FUNG|nr:uncharacterized protein SmJEL517_g01974 [Synchytrium microbalum]TPX35724.1 hypothetical protein SmJEL517_g01974 [Synchytrium microbalum]
MQRIAQRAALVSSRRAPCQSVIISQTSAMQWSSLSVSQRRWQTTEKQWQTTEKQSTEETTTTAASKEAAPATEEEKFKADLVKKDKQIAELQDAFRRSLAEQENLRQRTRKEVESASVYSIQKFAKDILETVDVLGMALNAVPASERTEFSGVKPFKDLYSGISMTRIELLKTLKRHGVESFGAVGDVFDPNIHQALFQVPAPDKEAGTVVSVQKEGFMIKDRVLRPAQVGVSKE